MTNTEVIQKLVPIYSEIITLGEDAKEILAEAKENGLDNSALAKIAKAKSQAKFDELVDKTIAFNKLLEEVQ